MKLFAIGDYDDYNVYAIVMAETAEEALEKIKNLTENDSVGADDDKLEKEDIEFYKENIINFTNQRITEIPSGIFFGENS